MGRLSRNASWFCMAIAAMSWNAVAGASIRVEQELSQFPVVPSCGDASQLELTVGLPVEYGLPPPANSLVRQGGFAAVCISFTHGTPYQLLSWLENSQIQVVLLPEFAVVMMADSSPQTFKDDYLVLEDPPFRLLKPRSTRLDFVSADGAATGKDAFDALFALVRGKEDPPRIWLPHHLSIAVDLLFTRAVAYADESAIGGEAREEFFRRLIDGIVFREPLNGELPRARAEFAFVRAQGPGGSSSEFQAVDRDYLVINRHILSSFPELQDKVAQAPEAEIAGNGSGRFKWSRSSDGSEDTALTEFYAENYTLHQYGSVSRRYFRFLIPELWQLLDQGAPAGALPEEEGGFALVLTGGGVKAAYQTRLVQDLYRTGLLHNAHAGGLPHGQPRYAQQVDYVIGTSGGALLGIFVSALDDERTQRLTMREEPSLTTILWGKPGARIRSWQVFPVWDLMRYASFVASFVALFLVGALGVWLGSKRFQFAEVIPGQRAGGAIAQLPRRKRWLLGSLPWVALLAIAPIIINNVAKSRGLEHVPALSGLFYLAMVLIAIDADQRLSPTGQPFRLSGWRWSRAGLALLFASFTMIAVSLSYPWQESGCEEWSRGMVWCSGGFALFALALRWLSADQKSMLVTEKPRPFVIAVVSCLGIVAASYGVLLIGMWLGKVAVLELTSGFWIWLLAATAVFSIILMLLAIWRREGSPRFPRIHGVVTFLFSRHPARPWFVGHRRLTRFVLFGTAGFLWWNLIAAPGLYGNCDARDYFVRTYGQFATQAGIQRGPLPLAVPFVVTATSLEKSQERYFLFPRAGGDERSGIESSVWFDLASDPRWLVVDDFTDLDLQSVAFASGSPFPVFSSHAVVIQSLELDEQFIDGGFAHNRPLDAAREMGARRVLVLNSTPLPGEDDGGGCLGGELTCNVPKLIPYLWERSQAEDNLSSMSMFVASIYPTPMAKRSWPALTDFYGDVVDIMISTAKGDVGRRVGVVESWGAPKLGDAYFVTIDLSSVERMLSEG